MKSLILSIVLSLGFFIAGASQCVPNPQYTDSVYGVWPDTTTNFPPGVLNEEYFVQIDVVVPTNSSQVPGLEGFPLPIDSGAIVGVSGLPNGLVFNCNSQTGAPCTYLAGAQGCATVTGTPTELGTFVVVIDLTAYLNLSGTAFPAPLSFDGYRITVTETAVGIEELSSLRPGLSQNQPNPFKKKTEIPFFLHRSEEVVIRVMDMLGQEVDEVKMIGRQGENSYSYEPHGLDSGIYLYALETSAGVITRRMIISRD